MLHSREVQLGFWQLYTSCADRCPYCCNLAGADDCKVKLYQLSSGFCYVTFSDHSAPVTSLAFLPSGAAVLSASLDGTVRAFDLLRYRNFRTLTAPNPVQFVSLAVENSGEIVVAGTQDDFQVGGGAAAVVLLH